MLPVMQTIYLYAYTNHDNKSQTSWYNKIKIIKNNLICVEKSKRKGNIGLHFKTSLEV